jgi:hypothetical protein
MILPRRIFAARGWLSPLSALRAPFAAKALVDGVVVQRGGRNWTRFTAAPALP